MAGLAQERVNVTYGTHVLVIRQAIIKQFERRRLGESGSESLGCVIYGHKHPDATRELLGVGRRVPYFSRVDSNILEFVLVIIEVLLARVCCVINLTVTL